ncbi:radical SAM family heme chaperone HemW [Flexivirga caeni]|uniref:Heme chaperone HemW n=1 Tax=Flexivirga caeni TaxID=2294115 RepID=A0A3M9M4E5_9MICO|nr:radical SAM family heme chaperone HemW [Flexivirga caeni]RNI20434.1 coproporphyrinogen III oxidase [Flexivirga caeni]
MPSALPDGEPAPADGSLPESATTDLASRELGIYLHVPFCRVRCGYCDFNTYTATELGGHGAGISTYAEAAIAEIDLAAGVLGETAPTVSTVFVGGGTPTMLATGDLTRMVARVRDRFGLRDDAEVTTEANPDTVDDGVAESLAAGGFTRVSLGMQSAVPHVLATLERTHDPAGVRRAVRAVQAAGLQVSVDLIYGAPGESLDDWRRSIDAALSLEPDHLSAYALVVEEGTKLAAQVRRGVVRMPDDDDEAEKYEIAETSFAAAGFEWYEISNWARDPGARCRHNELYWRGDNWWGIGPGAHSHVGGVRWWNVKHPAPYADRVLAGTSPAAGREILTPDQVYDERVLLGIRLSEGLPLGALQETGRAAVAGLIADGLLDGPAALDRDYPAARLTVRGRLLADTVVRRLLGW